MALGAVRSSGRSANDSKPGECAANPICLVSPPRYNPYSKPKPKNKSELPSAASLSSLPSSSSSLGAATSILPSLHPKPSAGIALTRQQEQVLKRVLDGDSVFITGSAGTGKTVLLKAIIAALRSQLDADPDNEVAVTASTGVAAAAIQGSTLHSFAGCQLAKESAEILVKKIASRAAIDLRWRLVRVLIIDEISMIDGVFFEKLEYIARKIRYCEEPFGGIQLVLCGDFFQLPPVSEIGGGSCNLAFRSKVWDKCVPYMVSLNQVFRQTDPSFVDLLNAVRIGKIDKPVVKALQALERPLAYNDGIEPVKLYPTRVEVDLENRQSLDRLPGQAHTYVSMDYSGLVARTSRLLFPDQDRLADHLTKNTVARKEISLKVGAQVMLVKNIKKLELVNGSLGRVVGFLGPHDVKHFNSVAAEEDVGTASTPLGNVAVIGSTRVSDGEMVRRLEAGYQLNLTGFSGLQPVVDFGGQKVLVTAMEFTVTDSAGRVQATRYQLPLILAYCLTIHKSQGQTISRIKINLASVFEAGQAYVALSRAVSKDSIEITGLDPTKIRAHPLVLDWYKSLP